VPTGVQAVFSSVGQKPFIDLTWAPNTERDLAGYHVFRKASNGQFEAANTGLLKAPAWRDENVKPGERYFYTVSAVDLRGNQSAQSSVAEESVP
jgi:predicted phage tail protein